MVTDTCATYPTLVYCPISQNFSKNSCFSEISLFNLIPFLISRVSCVAWDKRMWRARRNLFPTKIMLMMLRPGSFIQIQLRLYAIESVWRTQSRKKRAESAKRILVVDFLRGSFQVWKSIRLSKGGILLFKVLFRKLWMKE